MELSTVEEIFDLMMQREEKGATLYRLAAETVSDREARGLLEKLAQRCDAYRERLSQSKARGAFESRRSTLPDRNFAGTIEAVPVGPEARLVEVMMFAISKERADYLLCEEGARRAPNAAAKKLWLSLAEEERTQRLELEAYYEKEVISKI
ncbi:hypothetical protein LPW11_00930 [Geomonas sp. RF6]|uniref:hypothetical protein n=1 Tax=Geomonas sp. RF6 TaxID=2897342 RepID=UPI001E5D42DB|nr:hypothetical protein [Geomonas sp. RF6]UFS70768.1 hypothetical protein LPW11_00930 [Geomonas sp. RF6]